MPTSSVDEAVDTVHDLADRYRQGNDRPLGPYLALMSAYGTATTALAWLARDRDVERFDLADMALLAGATHAMSRTLAKDSVTSPLRAPFTRFEGPSGPGEVSEEVVGGTGMTHAVGELVTARSAWPSGWRRAWPLASYWRLAPVASPPAC